MSSLFSLTVILDHDDFPPIKGLLHCVQMSTDSTDEEMFGNKNLEFV